MKLGRENLQGHCCILNNLASVQIKLFSYDSECTVRVVTSQWLGAESLKREQSHTTAVAHVMMTYDQRYTVQYIIIL